MVRQICINCWLVWLLPAVMVLRLKMRWTLLKNLCKCEYPSERNEDKLKSLAQLPDSCEASADCLQQQRAIFEQYNVFSPAMIDGIIRRLRGYEDKTLRADLEGKPMEMLDLVHKVFPLWIIKMIYE